MTESTSLQTPATLRIGSVQGGRATCRRHHVPRPASERKNAGHRQDRTDRCASKYAISTRSATHEQGCGPCCRTHGIPRPTMPSSCCPSWSPTPSSTAPADAPWKIRLEQGCLHRRCRRRCIGTTHPDESCAERLRRPRLANRRRHRHLLWGWEARPTGKRVWADVDVGVPERNWNGPRRWASVGSIRLPSSTRRLVLYCPVLDDLVLVGRGNTCSCAQLTRRRPAGRAAHPRERTADVRPVNGDPDQDTAVVGLGHRVQLDVDISEAPGHPVPHDPPDLSSPLAD